MAWRGDRDGDCYTIYHELEDTGLRAIPHMAGAQNAAKCLFRVREVCVLFRLFISSYFVFFRVREVCVLFRLFGVRGSRIKKIVDALGGERIDLIRWNEDLKALIRNALQPADVEAVVLDQTQRRATVFVGKDQRSLLLGRRGINLKLAGDLCGYEIVVETV